MKSLWSGEKGECNTYICDGFITIIISILCVFTYFLYIALLCKRYSTNYCIGQFSQATNWLMGNTLDVYTSPCAVLISTLAIVIPHNHWLTYTYVYMFVLKSCCYNNI